jgi:hypothetical protein
MALSLFSVIRAFLYAATPHLTRARVLGKAKGFAEFDS